MDEDEPANTLLRTAIGVGVALAFVALWIIVDHLSA